jgi:tRNA pseudouridine55 synthase
MDGLLIVDKPCGITSHDVVNRLRKITAERSIGHLGTLDPLATGVLPLLLGRYTRLARFFGAREKEYSGRICFSASLRTRTTRWVR